MSEKFEVAVMHDYFVDRFVHVGTMGRLFSAVHSKASAGGGGIHGIEQLDFRGGNAVNLALALSTLGVKTLLITHSDEEHLPLLLNPFRGLPAEVRVKPLRAGLTVALEEKVNVMLGDEGGAGRFGPELLDKDDWRYIATSKVVCSENWAANALGTKLLVALRRRLGRSKTIYLGTADFRERLGDFRDLAGLQRKQRLFDWLGLNENEARAAAKVLGIKAVSMKAVCRLLSLKLNSMIDVHTRTGSFTARQGRAVTRPNRVAMARRLTGAGDVWDAASIFCRLKGMGDESRLDFANAAARLYVTSREPGPPTRKEVLAELE